jgi:ribonuclease P protein component
MFQQKHRLRHERDIEHVRRGGRSVGTKYIHIKYRASEGAHWRATIVASQKVSKLAVVRNRLKRQTRALLEPLIKKMASPLDIVIILRPGIHTLSQETIATQLKQLITEIARGK